MTKKDIWDKNWLQKSFFFFFFLGNTKKKCYCNFIIILLSYKMTKKKTSGIKIWLQKLYVFQDENNCNFTTMYGVHKAINLSRATPVQHYTVL